MAASIRLTPSNSTLGPRGTSGWPSRRGPLLPGGRRADATEIRWLYALVFLSWLGILSKPWCPVGCSFSPSSRQGAGGTEERVGGAGGGDSSPCSAARGRRSSRTDAFWDDSFGRSSATPPRISHAAWLPSFCRGGPPIMYGWLFLTMCQIIVVNRRITATRAIFAPLRRLICRYQPRI